MARYLFLNTRDEFIRVDLLRVAYVEADGNYSNICFANGTKAMVLLSLQAVAELIDSHAKGLGARFIRLGRRYIINERMVYRINIPRQQLLLQDFLSPNVWTLAVSKEALKALKELYTNR